MLVALGSLIGGAAGVAKAVNDGKVAQRQLQEMLRHNRAMEGRGLYLAPYKYENRVWTCLARWNDVTVIGERKVADFVDWRQQILQISIFRLLQRLRVRVHVLETYTVWIFQ